MLYKATLTALVAATLSPITIAQEVSWMNQFGTTSTDEANAVCADGTGGAIVGGRTRGTLGHGNEGGYDSFISRYDANGLLLWHTQFGVFGSDAIKAIIPDGSGGVFMTGQTEGALGGPHGGGLDAFVARYDELGDLVWVNQFGTGLIEVGLCIAPDNNGGVFIGGGIEDEVAQELHGFLARYDGDGNPLWNVNIPDIGASVVWGITPDGGGGVMLAGLGSTLVQGFDFFGAMAARYDEDGQMLWREFFFGDEEISRPEIRDITPDTDGNFIVIGNAETHHANNEESEQVYASKITPAGVTVWSRSYGSVFGEEGFAGAPNPNGGAFIAGFSEGPFGKPFPPGIEEDEDEMGILMAIDSDGNQTWVRQYGDPIDDTSFEAIASDGFGGVVFAGSTDEDIVGSNLGGSDALVGRIMQDSDGDGLLDEWETLGIPYLSNSGLELRLMLPGADPMHKDLYVEVDARAGNQMSPAAVVLLENAFAASPVPNPDGSTGITLHVQLDDSAVPIPATWIINGCWPPDFNNYRNAWYGTAGERAASNSAALLAAKAKAYRYCLAASNSGPNSIGGCGQRPGDNFCVFIQGYSAEQQAAVFMHELGHNLGLNHGGADGINGKPNYPSVMNYVLSYRAAWNTDFWRLDYSRAPAADLIPLDEGFLFETIGIGSISGYYKDYWMPYGLTQADETGAEFRDFNWVPLNGSPVDFGSPEGDGWPNGSKLDVGAIQDLNYVASGDGVPSGIPSTASPFQVLQPYDDWGNISLPLAATRGAAAAAPQYADDELTEEGREWIAVNFDTRPPNNCDADTNGDGILDQGDIQTFIAFFLDGNIGADFNGDGILDLGDIQSFIAQFLAGCS